MSEEIPEINPPLTPEEQSASARLTEADLRIIDAEILANTSTQWHKVARVVMSATGALSDRFPDLPYVFYAQRLRRLAEEGRLESRGNLEFMRFSEVRTPLLG